MSSIVIAGNTSGTVTLSAPAVAGTTTLTLPATSGTVITDATSTGINASALSTGTVPTARLGSGSASSSTYLRGDQTWASISSGGMTLLATVNATGNSVSATGLDLSSYIYLYIVQKLVRYNNASATLAAVTSNNTNTTSSPGFQTNANTTSYISGAAWVDLTTGLSSSFNNYVNPSASTTLPFSPNQSTSFLGYTSGTTGIGTATTTIYFRVDSTYQFSSGTFYIYGVK